ncbi:DUF222 domain-containing protein [Arthrobacter wenxiniae]|uniref:DUF222 domain-containing protein n=1 Tax=Arthrobacter wenxiniae TaxID=2713570 RepID=A0A7Y7IGH6_9MICC|nr:DUF222 domain-containing protein [Arthrobacter wenxiniae]
MSDTALAALIVSDPYAGEPFPATGGAECARQLAAAAEEGWPSDADIAALIASMPEEDLPWDAPRETAATTGPVSFPFPMPDAPWADPGQCDPAVSLLPGPADLGRVRAVRAAVPDLPEAPRPHSPAGVAWSPVAVADALAHLDPHRLGENDLLDFIHAANRLAAFARAMQDGALAVFSTRRPPLASETPAIPTPPGQTLDGEQGAECSAGGTNPGAAAHRSRYAAAEIMAVHAVGIGTAQQLLDNAEILARNLPATTSLYRQGLLDTARIRAILAGVDNVPAAVQSLIEPLFLPGAARANPRALTRRIRRLAQLHNPEPLAERHERARAERRVWFTALPDGMAQLTAVLDAAPAKSLYDSLEAWARHAQREGTGPGGTPSTATTPTGRPSRSLNNYLADTFLDLIHNAIHHTNPTTAGNRNQENARSGNHDHDGGESGRNRDNGSDTGAGGNRDSESGGRNGGGCGGGPVPESWHEGRIPATICVTVPALTLLGRSEEPGHLEGYGPIPPGQARELAAGSPFWERLLTDPATRARLTVGRQRYRPPADIAAEVRRRDPVCTGIGCDHPAASCDLDHTIPFWRTTHAPDGTPLPPGETSVENLRPRDPYCHHLKDNPDTGWTIEPHGPRQTKTTTPTGRTYITTQTDEPCPF